jgi:peptidyl-prolyl cis-trans isomerase A (cyclophilin A)
MMNTARTIALATLFAVAPAMAQVPAAPDPAGVAPPPAAPMPHVTLTTTAGPIVIEVETVRAPITAANFLRYVTQKRLDGTVFYRALNLAPGMGLIQGGVRGDPKRSLKPIPHEPTSTTGLTHDNGAVSMARAAPGTATGDFFVIVGAIPSLDAQPGGDAGFAVFGHVVSGMETVAKVLAAPVSPTAGEGAMKGQMIAQPVRIVTARRTD